MFSALVIGKSEDNLTRVSIKKFSEQDLPAGDVTVAIEYSTLNYKDALAITGRGPIVRTFPMVPGIDFAGIVTSSEDLRYNIGDRVVLNGWGVGEKHWGGLAQCARVSGDWLVHLPSCVTTRQSMAIGTAGYTAMLCVMTLQRHGIRPDRGPIIVTGASGGVGSIAIILLNRLGYQVAAVTGRPETGPYLKALGAHEIIDRQTLVERSKPLERARWAGAVDVAGGQILANICAAIMPGGVVTACGLAAGMNFEASVAPFILRGITLAGIDSVMCPFNLRVQAWDGLAELIDFEQLDQAVTEVRLSDVLETAANLLDGKLRGRVVVNLSAI